MLNALGLFEKDGQILVSSVDIAENFEKRHKVVTRTIENIIKSNKDFTEHNFVPSEYEDSSGRVLPSYLMTRDGFTLLVMGFTGYRAMEWKVKYIKAFNAMEAKLKEAAAREAALPEARPADDGEAARLRLREKQAELREREIETRLAELELRRRDCWLLLRSFLSFQMRRSAVLWRGLLLFLRGRTRFPQPFLPPRRSRRPEPRCRFRGGCIRLRSWGRLSELTALI